MVRQSKKEKLYVVFIESLQQIIIIETVRLHNVSKHIVQVTKRSFIKSSRIQFITAQNINIM
jgi:hypothetical protein